MADNNRKTAHWIAAARARETARQDSLFQDPYAEKLAGEEGQFSLSRSEEKTGSDNQFIVVRTKYFDDFIKNASESIRQIVLLGVGLDTRAFRLDLPPDTVVFEIDKPELLKEKEEKLDKIHQDLKPAGATRISVPSDLREDWMSCLLLKDFDQSRKSVWVAEGLFFYLSKEIVTGLMRQIDKLSADGSKLIFDISGTGLLDLPSMSAYLTSLKDKRLPLPYCTDYPEEICEAAGWHDISVDYAGSATASYGRLKTFVQDMTKGKRHKMNSWFVTGTKPALPPE